MLDPTPTVAVPSAGKARVLVLLRTHVDHDQVRRSIDVVSGGKGYDFAVLAHEEAGAELDFGAVRKITHSMQTFRDMGFEVEGTYFLMHCADLTFAVAQAAAPGYDFYVLLENDVFVRRAQPEYFERLAQRLIDPAAPVVDMAFGRLNESKDPAWPWHNATARIYGRVLAGFFPLVVLSGRAIPHLLSERLKEQARARAEGYRLRDAADPENIMFCEAFTGSALAAGGFAVRELNEVTPGAWELESFNSGPAQLMTQVPEHGLPYLVHPVLAGADFLGKLLVFHRQFGTLPDLLQQLEADPWGLPAELRAEFTRRAQADLAAVQA